MVELTLKCRFNDLMGISVRSDPSFHLWPNEYGTSCPPRVFIMSTTGLKMPGTAADVRTADQLTVWTREAIAENGSSRTSRPFSTTGGTRR
jgi:hypothetical protein